MITPFEIENKEFSKSMRGYNAVEVDEFLDLIILDLEKILAENESLKADIEQLNGELKQYKKSETSVLNTLESAKKLMNDISESAEKRAEIIIRNAKLDAEVITRDARESVSKLTEEGDKLRAKVARFKEKYRQILEDELSQLEGSSEDLFAALENDFLPASLDESPAAPVTEDAVRFDRTESCDRVTRVGSVSSDTTVFENKSKASEPVNTSMSDTIVVKDKTLEQMLMEDFGASDTRDLTKTRILK